MLRLPALANTAQLGIDRLRSENLGPSIERRRSYRVDAVISILAVTVYSQKGVGGAFASLYESADNTRRFTSLQFAGASNPEAAHGVNYGGSSEEAVEESLDRRHSEYFGFITASNDDDLDHARQHLRSTAKTAAYTAVASSCGPECIENRRARIEVASRGLALEELIRRVRAGFCANGVEASTAAARDPQAATFLYSVLAALRANHSRFEASYIHDGKFYRLESQKSPEGSLGLTRMNAQVHDHTGRRISSFKLWTEPGCDFPVRIEFQARSYIRLILEAA